MSHGLDAVLQLTEEYEDCEACPLLCKSRSQVIIGSGSVSANLMVIGEAPGGEEDEVGVPFVGKSGRLLMELFRYVWPRTAEIEEITRIPNGYEDEYFEALRDYLDQYIFWTNVVCCWPGEDNRQPSTNEIKACRSRLHRLIYAVDPMLIIASGKLAISALVGKVIGIQTKRGEFFDVKIPSPVTGNPVRYPALATLHPSFLLRKGDSKLIDKEKGLTYDTLQDLKYGLSILDKQYQELYNTNFPYLPEEL